MIDLAEILRTHGPAYREKFAGRMPDSHRRAMDAIERCRTPSLGGQLYFCPGCREPRFSYHSCQNRHCPKCQGEKASGWLETLVALVLPVAHFLVTFTVPEELRALVRSRPRALLGILFRASAEATQQLARDPRFLGGQIGMLGVLHTWTRTLVYHPHIHYLVPAGGLLGDRWVAVRNPAFLVHVKPLSKLYRAKFRDALRTLDPELFRSVPRQVWRKPWVVHCKPVGSGEKALGYLARYVFRVAISNSRLVSFVNGVVSFRYRDAETNRPKICSLPALEFIRRFLQHVLPSRFVKVRYYGLFAPTNRERLERARRLVSRHPFARPRPAAPVNAVKPPRLCPTCHGPLSLIGELPRKPRAP